MRSAKWLLSVGLMTVVLPAMASETITYSYDALGRLVVAKSSGSVNNNQSSSYCYDPAGNRTKYTSAPSGNSPGCASAATPASGPSFSISGTSGMEGSTLVFAVSKNGASSSIHTVDFSTASGTAGNADFYAASGTLTFAASDNVKYISIQTNSDFREELDEIFYVNLSSPSAGATISQGQGVGRIYDDSSNCRTC